MADALPPIASKHGGRNAAKTAIWGKEKKLTTSYFLKLRLGELADGPEWDKRDTVAA